MICPACGSELVARRIAEVTVDACSGCGGVWFDGGELSALARRLKYDASVLAPPAESAEPALVETGETASSFCPRCSTADTSTTLLRGSPVGRCYACAGAWVPAEELRRVMEMQKTKPVQPSRVPASVGPTERLLMETAAQAPGVILSLLLR